MYRLSRSRPPKLTRDARAQSHRRPLLAFSLAGVLAAGFLSPPPGRAQIYSWTDAKGTIHFTDNLEAVPPEHRVGVGTMDDRLPAPEPARSVPLEVNEAGYVVQARVNGAGPVRLVLDTGATATVLSPAVARRLGLVVRRDPQSLVHTAGGTVTVGVTEVTELEVGGRRAGPLQIIVHDAVPGADGLLGMDFLGLFRVELRADEQALLLTPR